MCIRDSSTTAQTTYTISTKPHKISVRVIPDAVALFYIFTSDEVDSLLDEIRANHISAADRRFHLYLIYQLHRVEQLAFRNRRARANRQELVELRVAADGRRQRARRVRELGLGVLVAATAGISGDVENLAALVERHVYLAADRTD